MRALLLAAGLGTRLRPITDKLPKCLVPIKGRALLDIWLEYLTKAGVGPFLMNTHYLAEKVDDYVASSPYHDQIYTIYEPELLGTAGTLRANIDFFESQDGMLIHADNYCLADFKTFIKAHHNRPAECDISMMIFETDYPQSCGILELDERGVVTGFHEKVQNPPGNIANGAIYILSGKFIKSMKTDYNNTKEFSTEVLPSLVGRIYTYKTNSCLVDIGTLDSYYQANYG